MPQPKYFLDYRSFRITEVQIIGLVPVAIALKNLFIINKDIQAN